MASARNDTLHKPIETEVQGEAVGNGGYETSQNIIMYSANSLFFSVDGTSAAPAPRRPAIQMPDEYLPPNKILFLQNLPESVTKEQLTSLFSQFVFSIHNRLRDI